MEQREDSGRRFRRLFIVVVLLIIGFLGYTKLDMEYNVEIPQIGDGTESGQTGRPATVVRSSDEDQQQLDGFYRLLNVEGRIRTAAPKQETDASKDEALQRRRENYRVKQELKKAYNTHQEQYGQLVHCGRSCESSHQQVELAYSALTSKVERELYGVLLDDVAKGEKRKTATQKELKEAYEKKKADIEKETPEGSEDRTMALEEIKDAYEILANPDARRYYHLYGAKPPEMMKHTSARYGGWGQELMLRTFKNRIIFTWMDYLNSYWCDMGILFAFGCIGFLLPVLTQLPAIIEMANKIAENSEKMKELEEKHRGHIND